MVVTILFCIFLFGMFFGSFATVLVTRWHDEKGGIISGRSACPHCQHTLSWHELIPFFSFLLQGGKCRQCKAPISWLYPLAELLMGAIFTLVSFGYYSLCGEFFTLGHGTLIILAFITGVYFLYDILFMEIPDRIVLPGIFGYLLLLLLGFLSVTIQGIFFDLSTYTGGYSAFFMDHVAGAAILYTFFYLQIFLPASWQLSKKGKWKELVSLGLSYITFPFELLFLHQTKEKSEESSDELITWVGGGDLRVALFIGITLGTTHGIVAVFMAYILGSIIGILMLMSGKGRNSMIAFGPFLALGWAFSIVCYGQILSFLTEYSSIGAL